MEKQDFEGMDFNPFGVFGETPVQKHYKRLSRIQAFSHIPEDYGALGWKQKDLSKLLSFIIIFVDTQSPFHTYRDFDKRKKEAKKVLKIQHGDIVSDEIEEEGHMFRELLFEYFRLINDHLYEEWFSLKQQVHTFNKLMRTALTTDMDRLPTELNARKNLTKEVKNFNRDLMKLESQIFNDDRLAQLINEEVVQNSIGGFPEKFAVEPDWRSEV
jgi:hypothetical protein